MPGRIVRIRDPEAPEHKNIAIAVSALNAEAKAEMLAMQEETAKKLAEDYEEKEKEKKQGRSVK